MKRAIGIDESGNRKLGGFATTYAGIGSCPDSCPLKKARACYGFQGPIGWQWSKLHGKSTELIAKDEAAAILRLSGERHLRIHTLGDCSTNIAAKLVSKAAEVYMSRHDKIAFTYTHAWRNVSRKSWGKVSVLASCEKPADISKAQARGYATAMIVAEHASDKAYKVEGHTIVPCPEQTGRAKSCAECRLCLNANKLRTADITIAFSVHGPSRRAKAMLEAS